MFLLLIPMVLVSLVFMRTAKEKGYPPKRFAIFPLLVGSGLMLACLLVRLVAGSLGSDASLVSLVSAMADVLALIVFFTLVSKAWKQIKTLPPAATHRDEESDLKI